jgi:hypothetical protein
MTKLLQSNGIIDQRDQNGHPKIIRIQQKCNFGYPFFFLKKKIYIYNITCSFKYCWTKGSRRIKYEQTIIADE